MSQIKWAEIDMVTLGSAMDGIFMNRFITKLKELARSLLRSKPFA